MRKAIVFILTLTSIFNLSGCHMNTWNSEEYDPRGYYPKQEAIYNEETLKEILACFDNKDFDTLIEMFSISVKSEYNLVSQIEKAYEIYGGESVSYESFWDFGTISLGMDYGVCVEKSIGAEMRNIKTTNNDNFNISFMRYIVNDSNPHMLGISGISLSDPEYGNLAIIGPVDDQDLKILKENNQKRNGNKSSENSDVD